jgi:hypothetical protein
MLQDKLAKEEEGKEGDRPGQIGRAKGYTGATWGQPSWASKDGLAASEGVDPECGNGVAAEAACSGAWSLGAAPA